MNKCNIIWQSVYSVYKCVLQSIEMVIKNHVISIVKKYNCYIVNYYF